MRTNPTSEFKVCVQKGGGRGGGLPPPSHNYEFPRTNQSAYLRSTYTSVGIFPTIDSKLSSHIQKTQTENFEIRYLDLTSTPILSRPPRWDLESYRLEHQNALRKHPSLPHNFGGYFVNLLTKFSPCGLPCTIAFAGTSSVLDLSLVTRIYNLLTWN